MLLAYHCNYKSFEYLQHKFNFPSHITIDEAITKLILRIKDDAARLHSQQDNSVHQG